MIQVLFAFIAGILTIAAPCILLPLPIVLGASVGQKSRIRPLFITLGFVFSFSVTAILINFLIQALGFSPNVLRSAGVVLLLIFALFMIWPLPFEKLMRFMNKFINSASQVGQAAGSGNWGGFILGIVIGIVWAPCAGPILGSILTLIALQGNSGFSSILLLFYALGASLPMLLIAYGGQFLTTKITKIAKYSTRLQQIFGVVLVFLAGAIYFQYDNVIGAKLLASLPNFGSKIETALVDSFKNNIKTNSITQAPEFVGISQWLNSAPLTMQGLRGKVVLIDFWTYSCINCDRTLPYVTGWYSKYKDNGLVVVGVHAPEFAFEKNTDNVKTAIAQYKIAYPVAQDNDLSTWRAYNNQYWPAEYLIDQTGKIVYTHFGEGEYDKTENAIRQLLGLAGSVSQNNGQDLSKVRSPEMYFGTDREENLIHSQSLFTTPHNYVLPNKLNLNEFALGGNWRSKPDRISLVGGEGKIKLHFSSAKLYMVAQSLDQGATLNILVDGIKQPDVIVNRSSLYTLFNSNDYQEHVIEITIPNSKFEAFTFTFG